VVAIYSTFLQRAFDQLVINVALQQQHVVLCVDRAGLVGEDGSTHHGALDLVYLRGIPQMRVLAPSGAAELVDALHTALILDDAPIAIRYPRGATGADTGWSVDDHVPCVLPLGKAVKGRSGSNVAILALGRMYRVALEVAQMLATKGIQAAVWDMRWAKPLDADAIAEASGMPLVVTLEEGVVTGGFGSGVLEVMAQCGLLTHVLTVGLPDSFVPHGTTEQLFEDLGLTAPQIAARIQRELDGYAS
jgi:1-deoxy-D-xylulose-5-phosphate synthase